MEFQTIDLTIPEHFMSALFNADPSGLDDSDLAALDALGSELPPGGHFSSDDSEGYFSWGNDVTSLGGQVHDVQYVYPVEAQGELS